LLHTPLELEIFSDPQLLAREAAAYWVAQAQLSIAEHGAFYVALAGGSTPRRMYEYLARPEYATQVAWQDVHVFFGDERVVPPDHPDSNYRMAREALLDHVPLPVGQVYPMVQSGNGGEMAQAMALAYARGLDQILPKTENGWPQFDLVMLGMGVDGHTASLFPHTTILHEAAQSCAAVYVEKLQAWRISLTFPVIEEASRILILVCGEDKANTLRQVFSSGGFDESMPITRLVAQQNACWYLDAAAASLLGQGG